MGWFSQEKKELEWEQLTELSQFEDAFLGATPTIVFKHSTRCSISNMALKRFESNWENHQTVQLMMLDLLNFRAISNEIATITGVEHQSPQLLLVHHGKVHYHQSHNGIDIAAIKAILKNH
ncbi:MAG: bacillithiol system redox-active protein YtxJ [Bacteroidota bacterium]